MTILSFYVILVKVIFWNEICQIPLYYHLEIMDEIHVIRADEVGFESLKGIEAIDGSCRNIVHKIFFSDRLIVAKYN